MFPKSAIGGMEVKSVIVSSSSVIFRHAIRHVATVSPPPFFVV
jgi:hypothetical protein